MVPALFPPSFPISHSNPVIIMYPFAYTLCSDHYKVTHAEGFIGVGTLMKVKMWAGPLYVLWFITQNCWEMVVKCKAWDGSGEQIVHFIVVSHKLVTRSEDIL
jgi:hypothetical protein